MSLPELEWLSHVMPMTRFYARRVKESNLHGKVIACCQHITLSSVPMFLALHEAGAQMHIASCNLHSTDDRAVSFLRDRGICIYAKSGMTQSEYQNNLLRLREANAPFLHDMGSDLISLYRESKTVKAALEATTTGLLKLPKDLPFPVYNWNDIPFKNGLHNRYHVAESVWAIFSQITGMTLFGKAVLVLGFGPVGRGIAERARNMGAVVRIVEKDSVRSLEAQHMGCEVLSLEEGLAKSEVVVTATGRECVIGKAAAKYIRNGAVFLNAGHSNREIDFADLNSRLVLPHIRKFETSQGSFFVLAEGALLNLATNTGLHGREAFDIFEAFMLRAVSWLLTHENHREGGLHDFPKEIELEVAEIALGKTKTSNSSIPA